MSKYFNMMYSISFFSESNREKIQKKQPNLIHASVAAR
jgi:hypothetical protein